MSSLISKPQQLSLDGETASIFLNLGMFSRSHPSFRDFFEQLNFLKAASDVILFVSQLINSMREKIQELFGQIGIQISEEQFRPLMKSPIDTFYSFMIWRDYFINIMNQKQRGQYLEKYRDQFISFEELISFSKSFYSNVLFQVYIRSLTGCSIEYQISQQMSVEELKMKIQEKEGIPIDQQRFIFAGKNLDDSQILGNYNITRESTISLVLRLRGGMHHITSTGILRNDFDLIKEELSPEICELLSSILDI